MILTGNGRTDVVLVDIGQCQVVVGVEAIRFFSDAEDFCLAMSAPRDNLAAVL